jgi:hypothetical protein
MISSITNQLGVDYKASVLDSVFRYVVLKLGWR